MIDPAAKSNSDGRKYKVSPIAQLHWVSWDDEYVVFDETSGQTLQFDAARAFVLNALTENNLGLEQLVAEIVPLMADADASHWSPLIADSLSELVSSGLVEVVAL